MPYKGCHGYSITTDSDRYAQWRWIPQAHKRALLAVLFVGLGIALGVREEFAQQRDHQAVLKGQVGLQDVDEVLGVLLPLLAEGALQGVLVPEGVAGELLGAVDGDGVGVVDQVMAKGLGADQPAHQIDMGLFEVGDVDVAQQPKQGVGMRQGLQFGEQELEVGLELGAGHLAVDLSRCIAVDRTAAIWTYDPFACIYCGVCVDTCPVKSLYQTPRYRQPATERITIRLQGELKKRGKEKRTDKDPAA